MTFRAVGGAEHSAVAHLSGSTVEIAPASLPAGWEPGSEAFELLAEAIRSLDYARHASDVPAQLQDVDGGWDVMIGNVLLETGNIVTCAAHGTMHLVDGVWTCPECGARAIFASG